MSTRTFIAVELNDAMRAALASSIVRLSRALPAVRFTPPEGLHLTLAFLGELDGDRLAEAYAAACAAAQGVTPFTLALMNLGFFGPPRGPRVLWAGVGGDLAALTTLHQQLAQQLEARGFPLDARPFAPHLTLARLKALLDPAALQGLAAVLQSPEQARATLPVTALSVMKSELLRPAARYTRLKGCPLG
ncbi:MAG TPA: RNA 2',3'-cyclic phosphodiesterase [Ktedonobacterales bacterium]|nr:RNA 2',3'-cyclic phosphodiesterase [Ktedonobacterales bacterium]